MKNKQEGGGFQPRRGWVACRCVMLLATMLLGLSCSRREKDFSDVRIAFFPGGGPDQSFAAIVYEGAKTAAEDLGCQMDYYWSYWNEDTIISQFREAIYSGADAICVVGHPGEERMRPLVEEAFRKNILVTFLNADLPGIKADFVTQGCGYVGQDTYQSGYNLGSALARKYSPEQLREVYVLTWDYQTNAPLSHRARRSLGLLDALKEHHIPHHHSEIPLELRTAFSAGDLADHLSTALADYPDTGALIADSGDVTAALADALKIAGVKPGEIIGSGFDLSVQTVNGLHSGYLGLIHDQQPFLQGYLPVLQACLSVKYGFAGLNIDTGSGLIDSRNLGLIEELVRRRIR